ncbi:TnsA endonuclease N-terminal domain-containing protein [Pseudomonas brassicacearum]|uniref:TnsA endonuclease N-terminal domain-containing protein n=1 Tax=Pseudomonas brassicacearum TaxID=930166 RepID=UPI000F49E3DF|nr:TnsA endonuclease N-terminal domain-containing protein [Pseudomonas brassicacearum]
MAVRTVVTRSSCHFRGYFPSLKNGRPVPWESQLEGGFFRLLELSPLVRSYKIQPSRERIRVNDFYVEYIPDVRAVLEDGREWWFEVKPEKRLLVHSVKEKMAAATAHFADTNRNFSIVTDALIWADTLSENLREVLYHRRGPFLTQPERLETRSKLEMSQPKNLSELCSVFGEAAAWRLLGLGVVGVDLEQSITPQTEIFLGGHRHADLFS